jgi:hypothetical protein
MSNFGPGPSKVVFKVQNASNFRRLQLYAFPRRSPSFCPKNSRHSPLKTWFQRGAITSSRQAELDLNRLRSATPSCSGAAPCGHRLGWRMDTPLAGETKLVSTTNISTRAAEMLANEAQMNATAGQVCSSRRCAATSAIQPLLCSTPAPRAWRTRRAGPTMKCRRSESGDSRVGPTLNDGAR